MATSPTSNPVRCRYYGYVLPSWLRIDNKPHGTMLLNHVSAMHPTEVKTLLRRMEAEDIATVVMEAFERAEDA
jgi:hypothetical protein